MESNYRLSAVLPGFEHIYRYRDRRNGFAVANILPGQYYVTCQKEAISTVLGSCISACIRDRKTGIGGMNHFMLPEDNDASSMDMDNSSINVATRYGSYAMERMINDILKFGGHRENLEIKITGGGRIIKCMTDVGKKNINFVKKYLATEGFEIVSENVGDTCPRKVQYFPENGRLRVKKLKPLHNDTIIRREKFYKHEIESRPVSGEVELF